MTYPRSSPSLCSLPPSRLSLSSRPSMGRASSEQMDFTGDSIGVPPSMGPLQGPPHSLPSSIQATAGSFGVGNPQHGSVFALIQGSHRASRTEHSRVLWKTVCGPQVFGRHETGSRPFGAQSVPPSSAVPDGDPLVHQRLDPHRGLCHFSGSPGRLFPHPHPSSAPEMASFLLERNSLPVQGSPVWSGARPVDLFQGCTGALHSPSSTGNSHQGLPRRLADTCLQVFNLQFSLSERPCMVPEVGLHPQFREIRAPPNAAIHVPGYPFQHGYLDRLPIGAEDRAASVLSPSSFRPTGNFSFFPGVPLGFYGISLPCPAPGTSTQETIPTCVSPSVVAVSSVLAPQDPARTLVQGVSGPMDGLSLATGGGTYHSTPTSGVPIHGRFYQRLGCPHGPPLNGRHVASFPTSPAHQPAGIGSGGLSSQGVLTGSTGQACTGSHRQHDCSLLSQQTGGGALSIPISESRTASTLVPRAEYHSDSETHFRETECSSGSIEQSAYSPPHGVDFRQERSPSSLGDLVHPTSRPLRNKVQQSSPNLRLPSPGPGRMGSRRPQHSLERSPRLRLSSHSPPRKGPQEGPRREGNLDSCSPPVARSSLVPRTDRPLPRPAPKTAHRSKVPASAKVGGPARQPKRVGPSRLVTVRQALSTLGASPITQDMVLHQHRSGTSNVYTSAWDKWYEWCESNRINPQNPLSIDFANYLSFLFKVCKLAASTVKVHRAAISSTIRQLGGPSFSDEPLLSAVVKSAVLQEAKGTRRAPAWDLFLVLKDLRSHPYEPIRQSSISHLTRKTAFLLMLASGRRGSEVHALSGTEVHLEADGSFSLNFLPGFLAKNQHPEDPSPKVFIKSLTSILCPDDEDRFLCPVRALKEYRSRTSSLRSSQRGLFLSLRESHKKDISRSSIARWVKQVIIEAYLRAGISLEGVTTRPHEVRALSASVAYINDCSLKSILDAAYWKSNGVFIDHYLRDSARLLSEDSWGIGSVVVAQQAISARPRQRRHRGHKKK